MRGTLILAVLCREGMVLAADKGGILENVGPLKDQDKLFDLGNNSHLAASGAIKIVNPRNFSEDWFNAITITRNYFTGKQFINNDEFWMGLKNNISENFESYLSESGDKHEISFRLVFFCLDHENKMRHKQLNLRYDGVSTTTLEVDQLWFKGLYGAFGQISIPYGLLKGEPRLASLRKHSAIKPFINRSNKPDDLSADQALVFIRKLMEACSQLLPSRGEVSREFDYVILKGGFQFVQLDN